MEATAGALRTCSLLRRRLRPAIPKHCRGPLPWWFGGRAAPTAAEMEVRFRRLLADGGGKIERKLRAKLTRIWTSRDSMIAALLATGARLGVDVFRPEEQFQEIMVRHFIAFLIVLSLAFGGAANAMAAMDCPFLKAPSAHDCCPPAADQHDKAPDHSKAPDCKLGQACRSAPAVAPQIPMLTVAVVGIVAKPPLVEQTSAPSSVLTGLWRPPRSI